MRISEKIIANLCIVSCALCVFGCATTTYVQPVPKPSVPGIYHKVERGQTLWRISKIYDIDLEDISSVNRIPDAAKIETGQLIFIPHRTNRPSTSRAYTNDDFIWPAKGRVVSFFGQTFNNIINKGINIAPYANTNVVAVRSGKVIFYSDNFESFGKTIIIDHEDGLYSVYSRNSEIFVSPGERIQKGAVIAKVGSSGRDKNKYLHFQIRKGHLPQNPLFYLP
ncbi:MAG: peptidoglycan DD-metalloendopeptidase family protein [Candidatus Omnitrophota bacterium]